MATPQADSNTAVLERGYEAFNRGDVETVRGLMAEDVEYHVPAGLPFSGTFHGPDSVVEDVFGTIMALFDELELVVERIVDGGDTMVVLGTVRGTASETGNELESPFAHVIDMDDGQITKFVEYSNTHLAREAFGT